MKGQAATYIHYLTSTAEDTGVLACSFYNFMETGHLHAVVVFEGQLRNRCCW